MLVLLLIGTLAQAPGLPPPEAAPLAGEWAVEIIDNISVMPDAPVSITFRGTSVNGMASCNTYRGNYTVSGTSLTMDSILRTMKACDAPRMSQETDFLALLRQVTRYELRSKDILLLVTVDNKTIRATRK